MSDLKPVMEKPAKGFTDLPPEIIENIGWRALHKDLANLRLVNKQIAAGTERPMLQRNFRYLFIMLAVPSSLRRALRVVRHPQLRRYISEVRIYIDQFPRSVLDDPSLLHPTDPGNISLEAKLMRQKHRPLYLKWVEDQEWLQTTGNDERELKEIFHWLRNSKDIEIHVHDLELNFRDPTGFRKLAEMYGDRIACGPMWDDHRPLQIIVNAIKESNLQPREFDICTPGCGVPFNMFAPGVGIRLLKANFEQLTHFGLVLRGLRATDGVLSTEREVRNLIDFLNEQASRLKSFTISTRSQGSAVYAWDDVDAAFEMLQSEVFFPNIESLVLYDIRTDYQIFISYLGKHRKTLKSYDFRNTMVSNTGTILTGKEFNKKVLEDLEDAGLGKPEPFWDMENNDLV